MHPAGALPRPRRLATALALAVLTAGVAGCGGDDDGPTASTGTGATSTATQSATTTSEADRAAAFKAAYEGLRTRLNAVTQRLNTALQTAAQKSNAQITEEFGAIERDLGSGVDELERLDPPAEIAADFGTATRTADAIVGDIGDIVSASRTGDPDAARDASKALVGRVPTLSAATQRIVKALGLPPAEGSGTGTTGTTPSGGAAGSTTR